MHLLVDGYNLLHAAEGLGKLKPKSGRSPISLEDKRKCLLDKLKDYLMERDLEISVVFDSSEPSTFFPQRMRYGYITIIFSDENQSADDLILQMCEKKPGDYVVISDDLEVVHSAEKNSCLALSCKEFIPKLEAGTQNQSTDPYLAEKDDTGPLYPKVSTRKKGSPRKLSKAKRRKKNRLKNL